MAETPESGGPTPDDTNSISTPPPDPTPAPPSEAESGNSAAEVTAPAVPEASADSGAELEDPATPDSFDAFDLPDPLRQAVAAIGWERPMPVQVATFAPLMQARDVMVQSQTGSGKTGAFCLPWLASRFEPGAASDTGVQLLVVLPTRELAKQVCGELQRLSTETPLRALPIYGGTAMQPQLAALAEGVHAAVGTPGRLLDHIRRRSLDLSRARTVVLDECDEMLSMGFLEDIRALLEACPNERQTCLFSATVPSDIERIARRYMRDPQVIKLSGDQVAAAEIDHVYYSVAGTLKTRDLIDVILIEEPTIALVFCNTREETHVVASVLRREGFAAEPLSSDLAQRQREHVMGKMRAGQIRFLVATDVAARGIDITHISHVINYSFPEAADIYIHRTGRTARAGRHGIALSLVAPNEIGSFYSLKLHHPSLEFEERSLPPPEQLARQRAETQLDHLSQRFTNLVSPEWTLLARNLAADPRGERIVAQLLEQAMTRASAERPSEDPRRPRERAVEDRRPRRDRSAKRRDDSGPDRITEGKRRRRRERSPEEPLARVDEPAREATQPETSTALDPEPADGDATQAAADERATQAAADERGTQAQESTTSEVTEHAGKRRRRRRRRKPRAADAASEPTEAAAAQAEDDASAKPDIAVTPAEQAEAVTAPPVGAEAAVIPDADAEATPVPAQHGRRAEKEKSTAPEDGGRRRKRRKRRRRTEAPQAVTAVPHVPQDQIVIDIEASELEVVREEFGEINELDDLTLKARRRAVIDVLQDEMELEDVSQEDRVADDEGPDDGDESPETEAAEAAETEVSGAAEAEPSDTQGIETPKDVEPRVRPERTTAAPKRKRRRRRKKKRDEVPTPELTAPPHKDFWEVWADRFTFRDFEDAVYGPAEPADDPEEAPAREDWDAGGDEDVGSFVPVLLNIGRRHGKKATHIRHLLRTQVGLTGKAIRDLTVRDASTVFRIHPQRVAKVREVLGRREEAGVMLELKPFEEAPEVSAPEEAPQIAQNEASEVSGAEDGAQQTAPHNEPEEVAEAENQNASSGTPEETSTELDVDSSSEALPATAD